MFAAAPAANTYETYEDHRQLIQSAHQFVDYPHYRLIISGGIAFSAGLVLAAIGFWILATVSGVTPASLGPTLVTDLSAGVVPEVEQGL